MMLLTNGATDEEIQRGMSAEFQGMTEQEIDDLSLATAERMLAESSGRKAYKKAFAEKRIHTHIAKASKRGAWGAVANLEAQLARIQGTEEPVEQKVTVDARLQTATLQVLGELTPEQVQELVAEELKMLPPKP